MTPAGARPAVVGFLGPHGSFSEVAAGRLTDGWTGELLAAPSIITLIQGVAAGELVDPDGIRRRIDAAVVPIENSTEGSVGATLDTLVDHEHLQIQAELDLPIEQLLVARGPIPLAEVEQVYSHPQGIAQARRFLAEHLPHAGIVPTSSTSGSVELVTRSDAPWAAIGSRRAAELYGATVLHDEIQEQVNVTRFVLVARASPQTGHASIGAADRPEAAGHRSTLAGAGGPRRRAEDEGRSMKTSVVFEGRGDGSPGWLVRCLSEFAFRRVNLSKIESRPLRGQLGHYRFFIDLEGAASDPDPADAIQGLRHHATHVRILGSYPVAGPSED